MDQIISSHGYMVLSKLAKKDIKMLRSNGVKA